MNEMLVAKKPEAPRPVPAADPNDNAVTTWKCYKRRVGKTLRLIGAHLDLKQEEVLELFADDFENYLITLQNQDMAERKRHRPE